MSLLNPPQVSTRQEVLSRPCPVPTSPGVYAWYFKNIPFGVPVADCVRCGDLTLLYVGIAPRAAPLNGKPPSSQRLKQRVRYHFCGNAEGSTLRLTLGCLLADELKIRLRRVGSGKRMTFADGEAMLSRWMDANAFVAWEVTHEPWHLEREIISRTALPLNLDMNKKHAFHSYLSMKRREAKQQAREWPIWQSCDALGNTDLAIGSFT
ncbi:hypothetical protein QTH97_35405 [Variovorax sp. J22R24]|uniref:GIY-YIG nuclease family protein n=1 Tax=Variovorax gracilis TaxID=3053502 RepID=UPI002576EC6F|nr:hypothetical protein [Variovorax sp. J22R24]MDM0110224.1 hypothetical protein [Variovorax sp. J22R24]